VSFVDDQMDRSVRRSCYRGLVVFVVVTSDQEG
jgi:hypothetical protein